MLRFIRRWRWVTRDRGADFYEDVVAVWPGLEKPTNRAPADALRGVDFWPRCRIVRSIDWPVDEFADVFGLRVGRGTCQQVVFNIEDVKSGK